MKEQIVRKFVYYGPSCDVNGLVAGLTAESGDLFGSREPFESVIDAALVFNLQSDSLEFFLSLTHALTVLASADTAGSTAENVCRCKEMRLALQTILEFAKGLH